MPEAYPAGPPARTPFFCDIAGWLMFRALRRVAAAFGTQPYPGRAAPKHHLKPLPKRRGVPSEGRPSLPPEGSECRGRYCAAEPIHTAGQEWPPISREYPDTSAARIAARRRVARIFAIVK
jgi:hypothetical protein